MQPPSRELLENVKSGGKEAFGELYERYRQPCYAFALMMLKIPEDAEDAVQNTFIRMYGSIGTLQNDDAFVLWMERILNRECLKIAQRHNIEIISDALVSSDRVADPEEEFMLPEPYAEQNDLSQRLKNEIERLPFEQRRVLLLFYYHELSLKQIADVTDSNLNTVKSRLRYARLSLKKSIEQQEVQSGDKFYGIPLLPFREILTRILDREKGKKKSSALWKRLQKDIDAVCGGFNGRLPGGGGRMTKIVAGVLAAMLALGAAAGVLTGAITQDSDNGWSNMRSADPEKDPKPIPSTEPGAQPDEPVQNPNQNGFEPFNADALARNVFNTPQNIFNNNSDTPAVLPTQATRNASVAPTQAAQETPVSPTRASEATEQESHKTAAQAYYELLGSQAEMIERYDWQFSNAVTAAAVTEAVVLADIYGDSIPELLFMSAKDDNIATLNIYTYDGAKAVSLLSDKESFRTLRDVDDYYFLYQKSGDKRLYLYSLIDDDPIPTDRNIRFPTARNIRFDESAGGLIQTELSSSSIDIDPPRDTINGRSVSAEEYAAYEKSLFSDISGILMDSSKRCIPSVEALDATWGARPWATSLEDTRTYLLTGKDNFPPYVEIPRPDYKLLQ